MTESIKPTAIQRAAGCQKEILSKITTLSTCMILGDDREVNDEIQRKLNHARALVQSATSDICGRHRLLKRGKLKQ